VHNLSNNTLKQTTSTSSANGKTHEISQNQRPSPHHAPLDHKNIKNTAVYTQLIQTKDDDCVCKTAEAVNEAKDLIEAGSEYICEIEDIKLFRKRK